MMRNTIAWSVMFALAIVFSTEGGCSFTQFFQPPQNFSGADIIQPAIQSNRTATGITGASAVYSCVSPMVNNFSNGIFYNQHEWPYPQSENTPHVAFEHMVPQANNTTVLQGPADIYWPKSGSGTANLLVYFSSGMNPGVSQQAQSAMISWNTFLQRYVSTGGVLQIGLYSTSNPNDYYNANITVTDTTQLSATPAPVGDTNPDTFGGGQTFVGFANGYSTLTGADIVINYDGQAIDEYVEAAHEFGHALGLGHSRWQRSIMFPIVNYSRQCLSGPGDNNWDPVDAEWIERIYDPRWTPRPAPSDAPGPCHTAHCPMGSPVLSVQFGNKVENERLAIRNRSAEMLALASRAVYGGIPIKWLAMEDNFQTTKASFRSLTMATPVIGKVTVLSEVGTVEHRPLLRHYFQCRIDSLYRNRARVSLGLRTGSVVMIADDSHDDLSGGEIMNDPLLRVGTSSVIFLKEISEQFSQSVQQPLLTEVVPFISKYVYDSTGGLTPSSSAYNEIRNELYPRHVSESMLKQFIANTDGSATVRPLRFGLRPTSEQRYALMLSEHPTELFKQLVESQ